MGPLRPSGLPSVTNTHTDVLPAPHPPRLGVTPGGALTVDSDTGAGAEICSAFGVDSPDLAHVLLSQLLKSSVVLKPGEDTRVNGLLAAVAGSHPTSPLEAVLAVQSAVLSEHVSRVFSSILEAKSSDVAERRYKLATRLLAAQRAHVETLHRLQNRGQQKIEVVHVHGQAVVGANIQVNQGVGG